LTSKVFDIAFVGTLPPHPGGGAIANAMYLNGMAGRRHVIRALAPTTPGHPIESKMAHNEALRFDVERYAMPKLYKPAYGPPTHEFLRLETRHIDAWLTRIFTHQHPNIVIIGRETFAWHAPIRCRRAGIPCVLMVHGATMKGLDEGDYPPNVARQLLKGINACQHLITSGQHMVERLRRLGFDNASVVSNPVDPAAFYTNGESPALRRRLMLPDSAVVSLHVSTLAPVKRVFDIVTAAALALRKDPSLRFVVVGDGPDRELIEQQCNALGLQDMFRFPGWIDRATLPEYFAAADIIVSASAYETQSLVYLETLASGKPLIVSDIPAAREFIEDNETGVFFRAGDPADLCEKLLSLAQDSQRRRRIGAAARREAMAFDVDRVLDHYSTILDLVIDNHRARQDAQLSG